MLSAFVCTKGIDIIWRICTDFNTLIPPPLVVQYLDLNAILVKF